MVLYRTLIKKSFPDYISHLMLMKTNDFESLYLDDSQLIKTKIEDEHLHHLLTNRIDQTEIPLPNGYYKFLGTSEYFISQVKDNKIQQILFDQKQKEELNPLIELEMMKDEILFEKGYYSDKSIYDEINFSEELIQHGSNYQENELEQDEDYTI